MHHHLKELVSNIMHEMHALLRRIYKRGEKNFNNKTEMAAHF